MDTSKHVFQLHGVNAAEEVVLRRKLRRKEMVTFFEKLAPTVIAIEACGASHHWARLLHSFGHTVKLIPPQLVKPYVKRGKNDAADAEALCEAMSRPTMRFVPVKTAEQQAALMLTSVRDRLIRNRTQLANAIRGHAAEFGLTAAKGMAHLAPLLERIQANESLPALARELFAAQAKEYEQLQAQIDEVDAQLMARHRADECSRRLAKIPGVGPVGAMLLTMKTPAPELFRSGRQFAGVGALGVSGIVGCSSFSGSSFLMPHKHNADRRHHIPKMSFKVQNWPAYEAGLRRRGSLTFWIEDAALDCWQTSGPSGQARFKDAAIQTSLMLRTAFKLALRQTEGLMTSVLTLMGLTLSAPDHTTVSRRAVALPVIQPAQVPPGPLHVLIDSTGLQVYGAGQWLEAKHGGVLGSATGHVGNTLDRARW